MQLVLSILSSGQLSVDFKLAISLKTLPIGSTGPRSLSSTFVPQSHILLRAKWLTFGLSVVLSIRIFMKAVATMLTSMLFVSIDTETLGSDIEFTCSIAKLYETQD